MNHWNKVTDKLPVHLDIVLVCTKNLKQAVAVFVNKEIAAYYLQKKGLLIPDDAMKGYAFCSQESPGNILENVTHWRNLIKPPKE
jgi:hypothetical protein